MKLLLALTCASVTCASPALAGEAIATAAGAAPPPASAAPVAASPTPPPAQIAHRDGAEPAPPAGACQAAPDRRPHGEVWGAVGTHGYNSVGGVVTQPVGACGRVTVAISRSQFR